MKTFIWRIHIFFRLWGEQYYDETISVKFAWDLAGVLADRRDELSQWEELK